MVAPALPSPDPQRPAPRVTVIVPHYNDLPRLDLCLASLAAQQGEQATHEVVVCDNNSPIPAAEIERVIAGRARLVFEQEKGAGPARNRAAAHARGEVLAFIDADCIASPRWIAEGLLGLEKFDVVGGRVDVLVGDEAHMSGAEAFEKVFAFDFRSYIEKKGFTGSGNLFCRRTVFEAVGGFRPSVSEDMDWSHRATAMGYTLGYWDAAAIAHPARANYGELRRKWSRLNRESLALSRDSSLGAWRWAARNMLLPASIVPHAAKILRSDRLPDGATKVRALKTLAAIRLWRFADSWKALAETREG